MQEEAAKASIAPPPSGRGGVPPDRSARSVASDAGGEVLRNRAGESTSPYVRGHRNNPVAWQLWGDEAIELAKKDNKLLFVSIGYSACHCKCTPSLPSYLKATIA